MTVPAGRRRLARAMETGAAVFAGASAVTRAERRARTEWPQWPGEDENAPMTMRQCGRVAVLADIHGNLPALEAVLAEPDVAGADTIVLLGDIALGPMPAQTLDRLAELGDRAVWVHGNCEREMITAFDGGEVPGPFGADAAASAGLIGRAHRDRLDGLPLTVTLDIDGLGPTLFCHASPRRDDEMLLVDSPPERWATALDGVE